MTPTDLERVYDTLAASLDSVGPDKSELFLAKLALLLSHEIDDAGRVLDLVREAGSHINASDCVSSEL